MEIIFTVALLAPLFHTTPILRAEAAVTPVRGVNLGGWFVLEPWITPSVFSDNGGWDLADEWSLCAHLGKDLAITVLENHWSSFYTRDDFVSMKNAGLNSVRIPIGYWSIDVLPYEPYVQGAYPYLVRAVNWARELGFSVLLDVHGAPGSQNGQDNSGLQGPVRFHTNQTNAVRALNVLRNLTAEFTQSQYGGVVTGIEPMNEPRISDDGFTMEYLKSFYANATEVVQTAAQGGILIVLHDAFWGPSYWAHYDPLNSQAKSPPDWLEIDTHHYFAFPPYQNLSRSEILDNICEFSQVLKNTSGIVANIVGEWPLETGQTPSTITPPSDQQERTWLRLLFEAQLAAYSRSGDQQRSTGWYFWCWKTEYRINTWDYRRGVQAGWIPLDVSNTSQLVFPILADGCVDAAFEYTAPAHPNYSRKSRGLPCLIEVLLVLVVPSLVVGLK